MLNEQFSEIWGSAQPLGHSAQIQILHNIRLLAFVSRFRNFNQLDYIVSSDVTRAVLINMGLCPKRLGHFALSEMLLDDKLFFAFIF